MYNLQTTSFVLPNAFGYIFSCISISFAKCKWLYFNKFNVVKYKSQIAEYKSLTAEHKFQIAEYINFLLNVVICWI